SRGASKLLLARPLDLERSGRQPVALSSRERIAFGDFEPGLDASLHRMAGDSTGSGEFNGDCADVCRKLSVRGPLGISGSFSVVRGWLRPWCPGAIRAARWSRRA